MTVTLPNLPAIGIIGQMYLMAFAAFLLCWLSNKNAARIKRRNRGTADHQGDGSDASSGFWTFISIVSGIILVACFIIGTIILISKGITIPCSGT